ncbi:MAG: hypothetical protein M3R26_04540, partial [Actinomycetota bacterium]|nr:hypothetical protein [Actinomycetota bacterium]
MRWRRRSDPAPFKDESLPQIRRSKPLGINPGIRISIDESISALGKRAFPRYPLAALNAVAAYLRGLRPQLPRPVWLLEAGGVANSLGNGIVIPFLIIYLHDVRHIG